MVDEASDLFGGPCIFSGYSLQGTTVTGMHEVCVTGDLNCANRGILCIKCSRRHSPMCPHLVHDAIKHMAVWPMTQIVH